MPANTDDQTFLLSRNMIVAAAGGKFEQLPNNKDWYTLLNRLVVGDLARHPKNTNSWFIAGRLSQEMAKYYPTEIRIAEERYRQAIVLSPKRQQLHQNLARLLLQTGRRDEALEVLKNVSEFDDQLGEGYWMYGLALFYDAGQKEAGAEQVVKAFRVPFPYRFQEARELLAYADALFQVNKKEDYDVFFERFAEYPIQTPDFYAKVAARFESLGLTDYRDKMLAMEATIPGIKAQYNVIMTGGTQPSVNNANPMGTAPVQPQPAVATSAGPRR
jgi:tetratricopeptide (TPR) repeat protein